MGERLRQIVKIGDQYYVHATSTLADDRTRILKYGDSFAIFNRHGDIHPIGNGEQGIYFKGTRHVSRLELTIDSTERPLLLSSNLRPDNGLLTVNLTNPDIYKNDGFALPNNTIHIHREKFMLENSANEQVTIRNYTQNAVQFTIDIEIDADFYDIFEVRGTPRPKRGTLRPLRINENGFEIAYIGLDNVKRRTLVSFNRPPNAINEKGAASFDVHLNPNGVFQLHFIISFLVEDDESRQWAYNESLNMMESQTRKTLSRFCEISSSNEQLNNWISRSASDLSLLITKNDGGLYPYAGIPWFSTYFGRDGIITALQCLWANPDVAQGVLSFLAENQAQTTDPIAESEPGKIIHEVREGEMANLGEIPFRRYYGTVDATPLFVVLAGEYLKRTANAEFIKSIWPAVQKAIGWILEYGDKDNDGFIEYSTMAQDALIHQGWKDSHDSTFHKDGRDALGNIALCEVQGYVYDAFLKAAFIARHLGDADYADEMLKRAQALQVRFEERFWDDDLNFFVLALDGNKEPCRVKGSNAGHCLFSGIVSSQYAKPLASRLNSKEFFTGWGIRTLAKDEVRYNPLSYHNGSIWPHDNAIIAHGLSKYGFKELAKKIFTALFDTSMRIDLHRLPELFCGFDRRPGEGPTQYPVACSPQAWASASIFQLIQALLGLEIDALKRTVRFDDPQLPPSISELTLTNLEIGDTTVDLRLHNFNSDVVVHVIRKSGDIHLQISK